MTTMNIEYIKSGMGLLFISISANGNQQKATFSYLQILFGCDCINMYVAGFKND